MKESFEPNSIELAKFKSLVRELYKDNPEGFYVNAPEQKEKNKEAVVSYIIRYTGRPVMAQSRIIDYDKENKMISYYYEDHKTEERIEVTESVFTFIDKLIVHIPENQFKMVRYYGLYATSQHTHKRAMKIKLSKSSKAHSNPACYRRELIDTFGVDPLLCSCGHYMEYVDNYIPDKIRGKP